MQYNMIDLLQHASTNRVSDVHITVGLPPIFRINGRLVSAGKEILTQDDTESLIGTLLNDEAMAQLASRGEMDLSFALPRIGRFRVNAFRQRKSLAAAIRVIRPTVPTIEELELPPILKEVALRRSGLFLVTGPGGSGKSSTMAAMLRYINESRSCHVITIEDPIEYTHKHGQAIINQREIGDDTKSFDAGLRAALREDPDVIFVGEMRDLDTISTAITASETGNFVLSTLHTTSAVQTIDRLIDVFPVHQQQQIRIQLAMVLQGILTQSLIPTSDGDGQVVAYELLIANDQVRNVIREGKTYQLNALMQANIRPDMIPMDYSLAQLVRSGRITREHALSRCIDLDALRRYLGER